MVPKAGDTRSFQSDAELCTELVDHGNGSVALRVAGVPKRVSRLGVEESSGPLASSLPDGQIQSSKDGVSRGGRGEQQVFGSAAAKLRLAESLPRAPKGEGKLGGESSIRGLCELGASGLPKRQDGVRGEHATDGAT